MFEVRQTAAFAKWLEAIADRVAVERIARLQSGLLGDVVAVGNGVGELRIHHGAGYRLYFVKRGSLIVILLCGGVKSTQDKDIRRAKELAEDLET